MKKLDSLTSADVVAQNIETLKQLFPTIVKEGKIDEIELKAILGEYIEDKEEYYRFTWAGKSEARAEANKPSTATLRPDKESSKDWDTTGNIFIEGDNLEVLKLLQKSYSNKIKMIYIDPPYNTGNDFVYKDNYKDNLANYLEQTGQLDEEGRKTSTNSDSDGRYHSNWLNMMYPRLRLARNLMSEDGVIFISIDDNEQVNLKKLCDEIFGEENFVACIIRNTNSSKNQSLFVSTTHDYTIVIAKNISCLSEKHANNKWEVPKNNINEYLKRIEILHKKGVDRATVTEELKQLTDYPRFTDFVNYWHIDDRGVYRKGDLGGVKDGNMTPLFNPLTRELDNVPPGGYRYSEETLTTLTEEDRIHFHSDGSLPTIKRYLSDYPNQRPKSIMSDDQRPDYAMLKSFNTPFDNPKQLAFMNRISSIVDRDSIILDFFSGSGTTAHAVMQLNAEDGGTRKCISVQLPEPTDEKSEAYKAGYSVISDITKERIRRAGEKIKADNKDKEGIDKLDVGFKAFKLDSSNIRAWDSSKDALDAQLDLFLENNGENIKADRTEEDILFEVLLKYGLDLSIKIEQREVANTPVYNIGFGSLFICLANKITTAVAEGIGTWKEELEPATCRVIFKDTGFASDADKTNSMQILKRFHITEVATI